jgi:hypothetical protein
MADYNRRFAKPARNDKDPHRPLALQNDLDGSFAWRVERTVTNSLTAQYDRVMFILEPNEITRAPPRKKVTVYDFPDGGSSSATRACPALLHLRPHHAGRGAPSSRTKSPIKAFRGPAQWRKQTMDQRPQTGSEPIGPGDGAGQSRRIWGPFGEYALPGDRTRVVPVVTA